MYIILTLSWLGGISKFNHNNRTKSQFYLLAVLLFFYGMLMEFLQYVLNTGRTAELGDILANTLGILSAFILFRWIKTKKWLYQFL